MQGYSYNVHKIIKAKIT